MMLLLIIGLLFGVWICTGRPRLEEPSGTSVRAWVDGKRVDSYVKEN